MVRDGHGGMTETRRLELQTCVISTHWRRRTSEASFVIRSLAGAASRSGPVSVFVPGHAGEADGAFDLQGLGEPPRWPAPHPPEGPVLVDDLTEEIVALLLTLRPRSVGYLLGDGGERPWQLLSIAGDPGLGVYVPINPLAAEHRHHGFGFTGYHLVLSGRSEPHDAPPAEVAGLSAAFPDDDVVVVEHAVASAWRAGTLRGQVPVDTRMDLWRLVAHANHCIDLAPGPIVARECVEAVRFGTPVVVPADSGPAESLADACGGYAYGGTSELIDAARSLKDGATRAAASQQGVRFADRHYGDPELTVVSLARMPEEA